MTQDKTPKKAVAKKAARATATKKTVKKSPITKTSATKAVAKKMPPRKLGPSSKNAHNGERVTTVIAKTDAGYGNDVYLRGSANGLSWSKGTLMENVSPTEWVWRSTSVNEEMEFKVLLNDTIWSCGPNGVVAPGGTAVLSPQFS